MKYVAYIAFLLVFIQMLNAFLNFVFRQDRFVKGEYAGGLISVLIPARNEETNIRRLLANLHKIKSPDLEIIVFDDESEDETASVVREYASIDPRIRLLVSGGLKAGWTGKNYACHKLAEEARGRYLLFTDADVVIKGSAIGDNLEVLQKYGLGLLSVFPYQQMTTTGEKITVPLMNQILLALLPLVFVRISPFPSHAAANGQFMLFDAEIYREIKPHEKFRDSLVEDIRIARYLKKRKVPIVCKLGNRDISCRMYDSYTSAVHGFSKNVLMFFGNSVLLSLAYWMVSTLGFIPSLFVDLWLFFLHMAVLVLTRILVSAASKQNIPKNLWYMIPQQLALLHMIYGGIRLRYSGKYEWKGRQA